MLKDAEENEDILYGQHQRIAFMLEDLDKPRLEEFLMRLEEFKERIEIKKQKNNCLDVLGEIKEMIENNKEGIEHRERAEKKSSEPPQPPEEQQEGRKLYATKYGEKYHLDKDCKGFNGHRNFEWKPCEVCKGRTQRILDLSGSGSSSSTDTGAKGELVFGLDFTHYHDEGCAERKKLKRGTFDRKNLCILCEKDERLLIWARNR
jgi:hypothetical protein